MPTWTPGAATGQPIQALHVRELRQAIDGKRQAAGLPPYPWTDSVKDNGVEVGPASGIPVRGIHFIELRLALQALWHVRNLGVLPVWTAAPVGVPFAGTPILPQNTLDLRTWVDGVP